MLNTYIKNSGLSQTVIYNTNNNQNEFNELNWDANYDGNIANVSLTSNNNGNKKHYNISLDNQDLANMLNVPSVNVPIDRRLQMDFNIRNEPRILQIELPHLNRPDMVQKTPYFSNEFEPVLKTSKPNNYLSSPLSNEELIVPITLDNKSVDKYTLTPKKQHRHKKHHKTYKVYKKLKSPASKSNRTSKTKKHKKTKSFSLF